MNEAPGPADRAPTILVVDDEPTTRMLADASLGKAGFHVQEAEDGFAAIAAVEADRPDLIMLDVTMPGLDGFETCARVRAVAGCERLPILMVTGHDDVDSIEQAYAAGATDFATKPINWALLAHRLRYLLRASETLNALERAAAAVAHGRHMLDEAERIARMGSWEWDAARQALSVSAGLLSLLGRPDGPPVDALDALVERAPADDRARLRGALEQARRTVQPVDLTHWFTRGDGVLLHVHHRIEPVQGDAGAPVALRATVQDVTERRLSEEKIRRLAYFDSLTGLPNRESFKDRLAAEVERARRNGTQLATLFLDLDEFKRINDTLGHAAGDELLCHVASRLHEGVRAGDVVSRTRGECPERPIARFGGDEFTVMLTDLPDHAAAASVAERILALFTHPVMLAGHEVVVSPSIGLAVFPKDGDDAQTLLECADTAMYFAKRAGKNLFCFYDPSMSADAKRRLAMENQLRGALARGELSLHYQPQMDVTTRRIDGVEALLRWESPEFGSVSPLEFIGIAEETRLIIPIGTWVLETACRQLKRWRGSGVPLGRVAVNISPVQFMQPEFTETVAATLRETGLDAGCLELEITETLLAQDVELAVQTLQALKRLGVQLSIDDFGTGYSSLSQLKRFPVDRLKIDRSFVRDITCDSDDAAIAMAVISMAASMDLGVVAEGVETDDQLEFLRARNCDEIQGFLISRPMAPEQMEVLLRGHGTAAATSASAPAGHTLKLVR